MNKLKTHKIVRNKPRHKISYQAGYNVWGKKRLMRFKRRKWYRAKMGFGHPLNKHPFHNGRSVKKLFGERLRARQVLRKVYGKITKRQFKRLFNKSEFGHSKNQTSFTGLLDRRLDAFVLRLGFAKTIFKARQNILHGSFKVNGKVVKVPSTLIRVGDYVSPNENVWSEIFTTFQKRMKITQHRVEMRSRRIKSGRNYRADRKKRCYRPLKLPKYIEFDYKTLTGIVVHHPSLSETSYGGKVNIKSVREHYG